MIITESVVLSMLGGIAGVVSGLILGVVLNMIPVMQGLFRMIYTPGLFLQAFFTLLVLGILGGAYPALRASRLMPVEALRYE